MAAPQPTVGPAARPAAQLPATPAPAAAAAIVTDLRSLLSSSSQGETMAGAERGVEASPREIAAAVRDILSPRPEVQGGRAEGGGAGVAVDGKCPGKSGKSPSVSRKRPRSPSMPSPPVRRPVAHQCAGDRRFAVNLVGPRAIAEAGSPRALPCPMVGAAGQVCNRPLLPCFHDGAGVPLWRPGEGMCSESCSSPPGAVTNGCG